MRWPLTVALVFLAAVACASLPVDAQRGSAHAGFSGHAGSTFHGGMSGSGSAFHGVAPGGFAGPSRSGFAAPPRFNAGAPMNNRFGSAPRFPAGKETNFRSGFNGQHFVGNSSTTSPLARSGVPGNVRRRMPYRRDHNFDGRDHRFDHDRFFHGGVAWPLRFNNYGYLGYPNFVLYPPDSDYDNSYDSPGSQGYAAQTPLPQGYDSQPDGQQAPAYPELPAWPASNAPRYGTPTPAQPSAPSRPLPNLVTIIFKDGRPPVSVPRTTC